MIRLIPQSEFRRRLVVVRGWRVAAHGHDPILGVALWGLVLGLFLMLIVRIRLRMAPGWRSSGFTWD